jgi:enoyl-CoA hydratase/carnithine racemase
VTLPQLPRQEVSLDIDDRGIATITLDCPERRNVISDDPLMSELIEVALHLNTVSTVRTVVLTGRGSAFSAGGNIQKMRDREGMFGGTTSEIVAGYRSGVQRLIQAIFDLEVPTIAAVNGPAIGAGFDLALACDLRLCSTTAKFGETFVNLGIVPGDGGSWLLPRAVGAQRAAELAFTGRIFGSAEALSLGIVLAIHEPEHLLDAAAELAATIAAKPATAVRWTKQLLRRAERASLEEVLAATAPLQAILHGSDDHRAALETMAQATSKRP